jgi:hypothetical protein
MEATDQARRWKQIPRLELEERDLHDRLAMLVSELGRAGREQQSDPMYQSLASALGTVRRQLALAREEGDGGLAGFA